MRCIPIKCDNQRYFRNWEDGKSFFSTHDRVCNLLKFIGIRRMVYCDPTKILGDLWLCAWLLKPHKAMWNGYMQMIHHSGSHPGKSTIINMPMTDMKSSDPSYILSTLTFISKQDDLSVCRLNIRSAILLERNGNSNVGTKRASITNNCAYLRSVSHSMSFLGSIGHLMTGSGLKLIYAEKCL